MKRDRTAAVVCHREEERVVVDRLEVWQGTRLRPVRLADVEEWVDTSARGYDRAQVVLDPWQAVGLAQRLRSRGLHVSEFAFTAASVGRLAGTLFNLLRDRTLGLPDDAELLDELAHVRLRESSPGVFRLDHDHGRHDDRAVAIALAATHLLSEAAPGAPTAVPSPFGNSGAFRAWQAERRAREAANQRERSARVPLAPPEPEPERVGAFLIDRPHRP